MENQKFDSSAVQGASESLGQKAPIEPRVIQQLDPWRYVVPTFNVTDNGIERGPDMLIELCRGNKSDPSAPRQNGVFTETLLEVCCQYLTSVNKGDLANRDTSIAITEIENALLRLGKRAEDRRLRGVQGSYQK